MKRYEASSEATPAPPESPLAVKAIGMAASLAGVSMTVDTENTIDDSLTPDDFEGAPGADDLAF